MGATAFTVIWETDVGWFWWNHNTIFCCEDESAIVGRMQPVWSETDAKNMMSGTPLPPQPNPQSHTHTHTHTHTPQEETLRQAVWMFNCFLKWKIRCKQIWIYVYIHTCSAASSSPTTTPHWKEWMTKQAYTNQKKFLRKFCHLKYRCAPLYLPEILSEQYSSDLVSDILESV